MTHDVLVVVQRREPIFTVNFVGFAPIEMVDHLTEVPDLIRLIDTLRGEHRTLDVGSLTVTVLVSMCEAPNESVTRKVNV
jgi:hypothetical protein